MRSLLVTAAVICSLLLFAACGRTGHDIARAQANAAAAVPDASSAAQAPDAGLISAEQPQQDVNAGDQGVGESEEVGQPGQTQIAEADALADQAPSQLDRLLQQASDAMADEDYERAVALCRRAIKIAPRNPQPYYMLGEAYWWLVSEREDVDEKTGLRWIKSGIVAEDEAIKLDPKYAAAYEIRGRLYALRVFDFTAEADPTGKSARRDLQQALRDLTKAIHLDPESATAYAGRARVYYEGFQEYDKALADANKALELDPDNEEAKQVKKDVEQELQMLQQYR